MSFGGLGGRDRNPEIDPVRPATGEPGSIWHEGPTAEEQIARLRDRQSRRQWWQKLWPFRRRIVPHG